MNEYNEIMNRIAKNAENHLLSMEFPLTNQQISNILYVDHSGNVLNKGKLETFQIPWLEYAAPV
jgi:hypothetical protein